MLILLKTWGPLYISQNHIHKERLQEKFHHPKSHTLIWLWRHKLIFLFLPLPSCPFHAPGGHGVRIRHVLGTSCIPARCPSAYFLQPFHSFYPVTTHFSKLSINAPWLHSRCDSFVLVFQKFADMNKNSHLTSQ